MPTNFEFLESGANAVNNLVFFPVSDLVGYAAADFANTESADTKRSKFINGFFKALEISGLADALGMTIVTGNIIGQSDVLSTITYTMTAQYYRNIDDNSGGVLPLPLIGDQVGVGEVSLNTPFPNVVKVNAGATVPANGVGVPSSVIEAFSTLTHALIDVAADSREWLASFLRYLVSNLEVRSATKASGITAAALGANAAIALSANATDATNPTTGLAEADLPKLDVSQRSFTITIQRIEDKTTKIVDVNVVTS